MGVPATKAVRAQRTVAHQEFDRLWCRKTEGNKRRRTRAYRWMAHVLGLPPEEAHISRFDGAQCDALLSAVRHLLESYPDYAVGPVLLAPQFAPSEGENAESAGLPDWPAWDNCPRRAS